LQQRSTDTQSISKNNISPSYIFSAGEMSSSDIENTEYQSKNILEHVANRYSEFDEWTAVSCSLNRAIQGHH
jgi:hypothetical protein